MLLLLLLLAIVLRFFFKKIIRCGGGGDGRDDNVLGITGYNGCAVPRRRSLSYSRISSMLGCLEMFPSYGQSSG